MHQHNLNIAESGRFCANFANIRKRFPAKCATKMSQKNQQNGAIGGEFSQILARIGKNGF
jgi:hypothetical protein